MLGVECDLSQPWFSATHCSGTVGFGRHEAFIHSSRSLTADAPLCAHLTAQEEKFQMDMRLLLHGCFPGALRTLPP